MSIWGLDTCRPSMLWLPLFQRNLLVMFLPLPGHSGTVKTSMNHPTQGPTQMFRRDMPVEDFVRVLENPRAHTGRGYQTRRNMPGGGRYH
jgi:hypothetical protein